MYVFADADATFNEVIQEINTYPQFFADSLNWGIDASFVAMGFMCVLALGVSMFKR